MDNETDVTKTDPTTEPAADTEEKHDGTDAEKEDPLEKANKIIDKLHVRIDKKSKNEKTLQDQLDKANATIKKLRGGKGKDDKPMVVSDDEDTTDNNIRALITYTSQIKDEAKHEFLKGSTPRTNGKPNNAMSKADIMKIKDPIKRQQAIKDNLDLFKH